MKKIKEINLNVDTSRYSSPYVKNRKKYYSGYSGGMTDSISSMSSTIDNSRIFHNKDFEEDSEEDSEENELMPENILNSRIRDESGRYSISETLRVINESLDADSLKILEKMEKVHKGLITDLIDSMQAVVNILEIPGPGSVPTAAAEYVGGTAFQFAGGNIAGKFSKLFAATRSDKGSMVALISEMLPLITALPMLATGPLALTAPVVAGINKIILDAVECLGNLGTILDKSDTTKNSLYAVSATDVAKELAGDAFPSAVDAADPTGVIDGLVGAGRLLWNCKQLWSGTSEGEKLIEDYLEKNPDAYDPDKNVSPESKESVEDIISRKFNNKSSQKLTSSTPQVSDVSKQSSSQQLGSDIPQGVKSAIDSLFANIKINENVKIYDLLEDNNDSYYGIDEDDEREEDEEIDEIAGYTLPLGATNKKPSESQDHIRLAEEIRRIQDWKLRTTGRIK